MKPRIVAGYRSHRMMMAGFWDLSTIQATDPSALLVSSYHKIATPPHQRRCAGTGKSHAPGVLKHPLRKYCEKMNRTLRRCCLSGLISLSLLHPFGRVCRQHRDGSIRRKERLCSWSLKTINSAQQEIRLMGYSFTSPKSPARLSGQNSVVSM